MKSISMLAVTAMLLGASGAEAATLVIDVTNAKSYGPVDSTGNTAASYFVGAGARITGIAWDVSITSYGINRLGDAHFMYGPEASYWTSITLTPAGVGDYYTGTKSYQGSNSFTDPVFIKTLGPTGLLYTQFYDYFPYSGGSTHVRWNSGTITLTYEPAAVTGGVPEPATWAMMLGGLGAIGAGMRRGRGLAKRLAR